MDYGGKSILPGFQYPLLKILTIHCLLCATLSVTLHLATRKNFDVYIMKCFIAMKQSYQSICWSLYITISPHTPIPCFSLSLLPSLSFYSPLHSSCCWSWWMTSRRGRHTAPTNQWHSLLPTMTWVGGNAASSYRDHSTIIQQCVRVEWWQKLTTSKICRIKNQHSMRHF